MRLHFSPLNIAQRLSRIDGNLTRSPRTWPLSPAEKLSNLRPVFLLLQSLLLVGHQPLSIGLLSPSISFFHLETCPSCTAILIGCCHGLPRFFLSISIQLIKYFF